MCGMIVIRGPTLSDHLRECGEKISTWNQETFGNVQKHIKNLKRELETLKDQIRTDEVMRRENEVSSELDEWLVREELLWKQRARVDWIKGGDFNIVFFKVKASTRKERKTVNILERMDGSSVDNTNDIMKEFIEQFENLFSPSFASENHRPELDSIMADIDTRVTNEMNEQLTRPFTEEEVTNALFQMQPEKAPGPDGFSALFFKKFWNIVKKKVVTEVLRFLNECEFDRWNETNIVQIPKKKNPI